MQFWAIIKLIAGIIANLPFSEQTTQAEVETVVTQAVECVQDEPGIMSEASIPKSDWDELIQLIIPIVLWVLKRFGK
jgi:hypothetical protein